MEVFGVRDIYAVLKEKGIVLPKPPAAGGLYTPVQEFGEKFLYCSGCGPDLGDGHVITGKVGDDLTIEQGQQAAYNCALNLIANLDAKTGDLNKIKRLVKVLGFINSADDFNQQPKVLNGASRLLADVFGNENGIPARTAMGVNATPGDIACEVELLVELK